MNDLSKRGLTFLLELANINDVLRLNPELSFKRRLEIAKLIVEIKMSAFHWKWDNTFFVQFWTKHLSTIKDMLPRHDHPEVGSFLWKFAELNDQVNTEVATWQSVSDNLSNF